MESQMILKAMEAMEQRILAAIAGGFSDREIGQAARRYEEKIRIAEGAAVCDS